MIKHSCRHSVDDGKNHLKACFQGGFEPEKTTPDGSVEFTTWDRRIPLGIFYADRLGNFLGSCPFLIFMGKGEMIIDLNTTDPRGPVFISSSETEQERFAGKEFDHGSLERI